MLVKSEDLDQILSILSQSDVWIVDVETNGLNAHGNNQLCGIGVGLLDSEETYYFPYRHQNQMNVLNLWDKDIEKLIDVMNKCAKVLIAYNIKFDIRFLQKEGLDITNKTLKDVLVMVRLIEHSNVNNLSLTETIKRRYGLEHAQYDIDCKKALRKNGWMDDFSLAPAIVLGPYCEKDVYFTRKIYKEADQEIKNSNQSSILSLQEDLTRVLYIMENKGVKVDTTYVKNCIDKILTRKQEIEQTIRSLVAEKSDIEFNIASTQQMGTVFKTLGISSPEKTAKGQDSWNEAALAQINHPVAGLLRQYRTLEKLRSTYLEPFDNDDGIDLHTDFCNWGTVTGRLSSRNPNLQNVPRNHFKVADIELTAADLATVRNRISAVISSKGGKSMTLSDEVVKTWAFIGDESYDETDETQISLRRLIVPRDNYYLVSFDYSQMEVRVFLSYIQNDDVKALLTKNDVDFHGEAAKLAFKVDENHKDYKYYRQTAKAITFGTIYGIGNTKLATQLNVSPKEAGEYKQRYFKGIKGSKEFFDSVVKAVEKRGWIKNRYGRIYKIDKNFGYKGVNYLVQGTSADIMSERMIEIYNYLESKKSNLLLQVHDEIICEIHKDEVETVPNAIVKLLEQNSLNIPLDVDMEVCHPSWATKTDATVLNGVLLNGKHDVSDLEEWIEW